MDSVFERGTVQLKGNWLAVWTQEKAGIDPSELEEGALINGTLTGPYKSNVLEIELK
jgi:hypothetical protein